MRYIRVVAILFLALAGIVMAYLVIFKGRDNISSNIHRKINVCTSTSLIEDLVKNVAGELVEITSLMGPGVDPHLYRATASDRKKLDEANLVFYNGLHLEGRMTDIFEDLAKQGKAVFAVTDGIDKKSLLALQANSGYDPHVWFDPQLWAQCVNKVTEELKKKDPTNSSEYETRATSFKQKLENLSSWGKALAKTLNEDARILITSHDAYNYFGRAFQFQVIGVQGVSTISEAGLADIVSTVDFIKKHKVKAIFVESSVSPAAIERISEDSHVNIGGELFSDSLGTNDETLSKYNVGTYIGMFKYNMETIVKGLK